MCRKNVSWRSAAVLVLILTAASGSMAQVKASGPAGAGKTPASSPETLRTLVQASRLAELRWPDFSDYRVEVEKFYARADYAPVWLRNGQPTAQALQMIDVLRAADSEGLHAEDYDSSRWPERLITLQRQHSGSDELHFDLALTVCGMRYSAALREGRVDPQNFKAELGADAEKFDLPRFVQQQLVNGQNLKGELSGLEPPFAGYRELRKVLLTYAGLARLDDGEKLPLPTDIGYPGPPYAGFTRLARLLRLLGDLPDDYSVEAASSRVFDPDLIQGVQHFQERHGLAGNGYLNAATIEQLNVPLSYRVEQIQLALERYRWLRRNFSPPAIVVNIPGFQLFALNEARKAVLSMKVDVGEDFDQTRTPVMEDSIEYLVF